MIGDGDAERGCIEIWVSISKCVFHFFFFSYSAVGDITRTQGHCFSFIHLVTTPEKLSAYSNS